MCLFFSLIPATWFLVAGFFVLFAAGRSKGTLRKCGQLLAAWIILLAVAFPIAGAFVTLSDQCPVGQMMETMHDD